MRDILITEVPVVLRADLYALAALAGAAVVVVGQVLHVSSAAAMTVAHFSALGSALWRSGMAGGFPLPPEDERQEAEAIS